MIENKYESQKSITSFHRFFAASNKSHFLNVDADDRRLLFLRVSEFKAQNVTYYANIRDAFKNKEIMGAFLQNLITRDISKFNYRERPKTLEHTVQKIQSLHGFERWWYEELTNPFGVTAWVEGQMDFISSQSLINAYKDSDRNSERYASIQLNQISAILKKVCPSIQHIRVSISNKSMRGYKMPKIEIARKEFCRYIGSEIDWQDPMTSPMDTLELNYALDEENRKSHF